MLPWMNPKLHFSYSIINCSDIFNCVCDSFLLICQTLLYAYKISCFELICNCVVCRHSAKFFINKTFAHAACTIKSILLVQSIVEHLFNGHFGTHTKGGALYRESNYVVGT